MNCKESQERLLDMVDGGQVAAELKEHVSRCGDCTAEFNSLLSTISMLDEWKAPEPSPYFGSRMRARFRAEAEAAPSGWRARIQSFSFLSHSVGWRTATACALGLAITVGAGIYKVSTVHTDITAQGKPSGAVADLEKLDDNKELLAALDSLDDGQDNDQDAEY